MLWLGHREYVMVGTLKTCYSWDIVNMLWLGHREYAMVGTLRTCNGRDIENNQQVIALNSRLQLSFLAWLDSRTIP